MLRWSKDDEELAVIADIYFELANCMEQMVRDGDAMVAGVLIASRFMNVSYVVIICALPGRMREIPWPLSMEKRLL